MSSKAKVPQSDVFAGLGSGTVLTKNLEEEEEGPTTELQSSGYNSGLDESTLHSHVTLVVGSNYEARTLGPMVKKSPELDL